MIKNLYLDVVYREKILRRLPREGALLPAVLDALVTNGQWHSMDHLPAVLDATLKVEQAHGAIWIRLRLRCTWMWAWAMQMLEMVQHMNLLCMQLWDGLQTAGLDLQELKEVFLKLNLLASAADCEASSLPALYRQRACAQRPKGPGLGGHTAPQYGMVAKKKKTI